jgi:predicted DNA-binding transcriptional regulator AlpA
MKIKHLVLILPFYFDTLKLVKKQAQIAPIVLQPGDILTPEQLAERLQVSPSWIYEKSRRRSRNPLPVFRIGRYLRFSWTAVCAWLATTSQPA